MRTATETALRRTFATATGLVLLTPLVMAYPLVHPFTTGKALWSRPLCALAFAAWAMLAAAHPRYRAPRSWVLVLLGVNLAVGLASALAGASLERSLWSEFERMNGLVDQAHWAAFTVALAGMLRRPDEWDRLMKATVGLAAGLVLAIEARRQGVVLPWFGWMPEPYLPRWGGTLGNPLHLGLYVLVAGVLAVGLARNAWQQGSRGAALGWAAAAATLAWGIGLSGSVSAFAGLAAAAALGVGAWCAAAGRDRFARRAIGAAAAIALGGLAGAALLDDDTQARRALRTKAPSLDYVLSTSLDRPSVRARLAAWEAAWQGFRARPVLGWGPENFEAVFGRYASGYARTAPPHDHAHNYVLELAATRGTVGLAAWLATWALATAVLVRAWHAHTDPRRRAMQLAAACAIAGWLGHGLFVFETSTSSLLAAMLLAFAARCEPQVIKKRRRPGGTGPAPDAAGARKERAARWAGAALAAGAAVATVTTHATIASAAHSDHLWTPDRQPEVMAAAIARFPPLANTWRRHLVATMAARWPDAVATTAEERGRRLAWAAREAQRGLETAPGNWPLAHALADLLAKAAKTDPAWRSAAAEAMQTSRTLAPNRPIAPPIPPPPRTLEVRARDDGRLVLRWPWSQGAGHMEVHHSTDGETWRLLHHAYGPHETEIAIAVDPHRPLPRYRIKACLHSRACSASLVWPSPEPDTARR